MKRIASSAKLRFPLLLLALTGLVVLTLLWKGVLPVGAILVRGKNAAFVPSKPVVNVHVAGAEIPNMALIGDEFCYTARITNSGDTGPGFVPYLRLITPNGVTLTSATLLNVGGNGIGNEQSTFSLTTPLPVPLPGQDPLLPPGNIVQGTGQLWIIQPPIGSVVSGQSAIDVRICLKVTDVALVNQQLQIKHQPVYLYGTGTLATDNQNFVLGDEVFDQVMPVVVKFRKVVLNAPVNDTTGQAPFEFLTGECNPVTFQLVADIATTVTLNNLVFNDLFPTVNGAVGLELTKNLSKQVKIITPGGSKEVTANLAGNVLSVSEPSASGVLVSNVASDQDVIVEFQANVPKAFFNNASNTANCPLQNLTNTATFDAQYNGLSISQLNSSLSFTVKVASLQKTASPAVAAPGDTINFALKIIVSESDTLEVIDIDDVLPDGLTYVSNSVKLMINGNDVSNLLTVSYVGKTLKIHIQNGTSITPIFGACVLNEITYQAVVDQNYPNGGAPVLAGDKLLNVASMGYGRFTNEHKQCYPINGYTEKAASQVVIRPVNEVTKSIINNPLPAQFLPGDKVKFSLKMCLPSGDAKGITFKDYLPAPIFDLSSVAVTNFIKTPSSVNATLDPPLPNPQDNSVMFTISPDPFVTNPTTPTCFEIQFEVTVASVALPSTLSVTNYLTAKTVNSSGVEDSHTVGVVLTVGQGNPNLTITKSICNTPSSLDAGDKVTFCITVKNESAATAYNAKATDIVPTGMTYVSNSLVQVGTTPQLTLNAQNPSTTGLTATASTLNAGQSFSIEFAATLGNDVEPCKTYTNEADVSWTASSNSTTILTGDSATVTVTIAKPTITKTIKEPNPQNHTIPPDVAIGEEIVYEVKVCLPEGKTPSVTVVDALPPNVQCVKVTPGGLFSGNLSCPGPWTFTNISVPGDNNTTNNCGTVEIRTIVKDIPTIIGGIPANIGCAQNQTQFENKASAKVGQCDTIESLPVRSRIVEPKLNIKKEFIPATAKPGDMVNIKLTLSNNGTSSCTPTSSAFDVILQDKLASNFTNVTAVTTPAGFTYGYNSGANQVTYTSGKDVEVKAQAVLEFTFKATVQKPCGMVPNTATIAQATTMGGPMPVDGERTITSAISTVSSMTSTATLEIKGGSCGCADLPQITNNLLPNLIGWWPLDEPNGTSGVMVKDIAKNYHGKPQPSGTVGSGGSPSSVSSGYVATSFGFSSTSYVEVQKNSDLDIGTNDLTIDAWVFTDGFVPTTGQTIVNKLDLTGGLGRGYSLSINGTGKLVFMIGGAGSGLVSYTSSQTLSATGWKFVAVTVKRNPGEVKFYVDNTVSTFTSPAVPTGSVTNTKNFRIGGGNALRLDEVEIFNVALPQSSLDLIRGAQTNGKCKDNTCLTNPIKILTTTLPPGKKGQPYSQQIKVSGGVSPYMFELIGTLPNGLTLNKTTGFIEGIPLNSQSLNFIVKVTDARGCVAMAKYGLVIKQLMIGLDYNVTSTAGFAGQDAAAQQNGTLTLSVNLEALGNEKTASFSLSYDPALLSNPVVTLGSGAAGATLLTNTSQTGQGRIGILLTMPGNQTFPEGLLQVARVSFGLVLKSPAPVTKIEFGDTPTTRNVSDTSGNRLETQYESTPAVIAPKVVTVSAANYAGDRLASEQIAAAFGTNLATGVQSASGATLPTTLLGTTVRVIDSAGVERLAPLFFVAPSQVNYLLPTGLAPGAATISITSGNGAASGGVVKIAAVAPGIFTADASGRGFPAANLFRLRADGSSVIEPIVVFDPAQGKLVPKPIDVGEEGDRIFLILFATAVQGRSNLSAVEVTIGGLSAEVSYAGPQGDFFGLDQLNIEIPRSLAGQGLVDVLLTVDGFVANIVQVSIL